MTRNNKPNSAAGPALLLACALLLAGCAPRAPAGSATAVVPEAAAPAAASASGISIADEGEPPGQRAAQPEPPPEAAPQPHRPAAVEPSPTAEEVTPPEAPLPPAEASSQPAASAYPETPPEPQPEPEPPMPVEHPAVLPLTPDIVERIHGVSWRDAETPVPLEDLRYLAPRYVGFDGVTYIGELIAHRSLAGELADIFEELYAAGFPLAGMRLIDDFGGDDNASMAAGNTSCLNTRLIAGTGRYSMHSYGAAVDLNPLQNPYVLGGRALPEASAAYLDRADARPGMITEGSLACNAFTSRGWVWGGSWPSPDYQHFEKAIVP